jgi:glutamate-ammonia-ligase adenylyltransferase
VEKDFGRLSLQSAKGRNRFVILGMGKLGGEELNFSSDIDIVYLYEEDDGESDGGRKRQIDPRGFFTRLAEMITRLMGEITDEGFVFRTDLRLRPLGRHGPIVQSLSSALLYYESWGQCWERAALIKARPVAGDTELGLRFLREIEPFIYRRYLDFTTVDELREMKSRIERELLIPANKKRNVKLGTGGIREIEFFTQALQLVNGGYEPRIRDHNTLRALDLLVRCDYIPSDERTRLNRAYRFLRNVEHKVQMVQEAHTYSIPEGQEEEIALAHRLGYSRRKGKSERVLFWQDYRKHTTLVRRAFDRLFYGAQNEMSSESASGLGRIWNDLDQEEMILAELKEVGFADPERAYHNLLAVRNGEPFSPPSPRRLKVMRILGPALMEDVVRSGSPDQALFNLAEFGHRVGARTGFLSLLAENPKVAHLLITLFASSQFLTDLFLKRPELLDSLIRADLTQPRKTRDEMRKELAMAVAAKDDLESRLNAMRHYKAEESLRIGLHDLGGELDLEEAIGQLSDLAEACLESALTLSTQEIEKGYGSIPKGQFAVLGMGQLGGREIDYNSDLDLIFVYDAPEEARSEGGTTGFLDAHDYYVRLGQKLITFLSSPTEEGILYKIDMRLRPSGRLGPLVSSFAAFRHYHQTTSELWERQALIKMRFVAGDPRLGQHAEEVADGFVYRKGLTQDGVAEIHHLRMRMERELARENISRFNLKKGKGGMVDIEFLAQMLQLSHGCRYPRLRLRGTLDALRTLHAYKTIKKSDYLVLSEGYLFLRHLDHRLRLERGQSLDTIEREADKLQGIAQALGYRHHERKSAGSLLLRDYERRRERIRSCYERFFKPESEGSPDSSQHEPAP